LEQGNQKQPLTDASGSNIDVALNGKTDGNTVSKGKALEGSVIPNLLNRGSICADVDLEEVEDPNRFPALSTHEQSDDVVIPTTEVNRLNIVNVKDDSEEELSSEESEYVEDTQLQLIENAHNVDNTDVAALAEVLVSNTSRNMNVPERVQTDVQFLKDSWANMDGKEDADNRLLAALERDEPILDRDNDEGPSCFTLVQTKRKSKSQKQRMTGKSYSTRSKVCHDKPFK